VRIRIVHHYRLLRKQPASADKNNNNDDDMKLQQRRDPAHEAREQEQGIIGSGSDSISSTLKRSSRKWKILAGVFSANKLCRSGFLLLLLVAGFFRPLQWTSSQELSSDQKYILGVYLYGSEFNDKLNRWWRRFLPLADASNRTLVLPWFNVHQKFQRSFRRFDYEPYEMFFRQDAVAKVLPVVTLDEYLSEFGQEADLVVFHTEYANKVLELNCEDNEILYRHHDLSVFGMTFGAGAILCSPDGKRNMYSKLFQLIKPYETVILCGFDSRSNHGKPFRVSLPDERQDELQASVQIAPYIQERARRYLKEECLTPVAAIHWRAAYSSAEDLIARIRAWIPELKPPPASIFLATEEMNRTVIEFLAKSVGLPLVRYDPLVQHESDARLRKPGVIAVLDQSMCIEADHFLGNQLSTFTESIVKHRSRTGKVSRRFRVNSIDNPRVRTHKIRTFEGRPL
jgi:hypothetical protein